MFFVRFIKPVRSLLILLAISFGIAGCGEITDDLNPSGDDNRQVVEVGTFGPGVGQFSEEFFLQDTFDNTRGLYDELSRADAVVLYFTMWCPLCDVHMSLMRTEVIPNFPNVSFFLVDYVMGTVAYSRAAQQTYGFSSIETLVDTDQVVFNLYQAAMGSVVVINSADNVVMMNEDYKDGVKLIETLQALP